MDDDQTFFIGELAERTGLGRDTIRYYESIGVLLPPPRNDGGYRLYRPDAVERLAFVGQAQTLGLRLEQIREVLELVDAGREPCVHVREQLSARLDETRQRIRDLRRLERRLGDTLARTASAPPESGCRCRIIEAGGGGT